MANLLEGRGGDAATEREESAPAAQARLGSAISAGRPFTDSLTRCDRKWAALLADQRYDDVRLKPALYTYEAAGLAAPAL
jgi:hypothetical protein